MYAVIMAGGRGTRFWPRSRKRTPKQLLNIAGKGSMIRETVARIRPLVKPEEILVVIGRIIEDEVKRQLPEVPVENIIVEPVGRSTAACIGLAALYIKRKDEEAVMAVLPADHVIKHVEQFRQIMAAAERMAFKDHYLVTIGIRPTHPETGYGHIHFGEEVKVVDGQPIYKVLEFTEKPSLELAEQFMATGEYLWNSGMFFWKLSTIFENLRVHMPQLYDGLVKIEKALGTPREQEVIESVYQSLESVSIDYGVMEKAERVVVIPAGLGWSDVGSWTALEEVRDKDPQGNVFVGDHINIDTRDSIVFSPEKLVATIGLKDIIVIETEDALLICPKERAQEVKHIVELLEERGMEEYL